MNKYEDFEILEDEILSIEEFETMDTIDIEVDSVNRLFFANDILTHNSGWEANDLGITSIAESAGLLHTVDLLFGLVTNAEMKARGEYFLKCLANRVAGLENTRKRYTMDWKYARIEEDRNSPIQDMEFFINSVVVGARHARGTPQVDQQIIDPIPIPTPSLDNSNLGVSNNGLFTI